MPCRAPTRSLGGCSSASPQTLQLRCAVAVSLQPTARRLACCPATTLCCDRVTPELRGAQHRVVFPRFLSLGPCSIDQLLVVVRVVAQVRCVDPDISVGVDHAAVAGPAAGGGVVLLSCLSSWKSTAL
jgi:hypothetical protein